MVNDNYREGNLPKLKQQCIDPVHSKKRPLSTGHKWGGSTTHWHVLAFAGVRIPDINKLWQIWSGNLYTCDPVPGQLVLLILAGQVWFSARFELSRAGLDQIITSHHVYASAWSFRPISMC
jgi:hypothetical protein